jgi:transposase
MAMTTMPDRITGGVDTHLDVHVCAALNGLGGLLGVESFPATAAGYRAMLGWLKTFGDVERVGVEGTSSYGTGLARYLRQQQVAVIEVHRPNRQSRRLKGKSDPADAISAARAVLSGEAQGQAKAKDGNVEAIRLLRLVKHSANRDRTCALNQMRSIVSTAPDELRDELRNTTIPRLLGRCTALRAGKGTDVAAATKLALGHLAQRVKSLDAQIKELDSRLGPLVKETAPKLVNCYGVGPDTAATILVAAGDNPERLRNERSFARLCGAAPLDASSGKQQHHRLSRAGNRQANSALWRIVMTRMTCDPKTIEYLQRRTKEGKTKREVIRCLKRFVAREVFAALPERIAA